MIVLLILVALLLTTSGIAVGSFLVLRFRREAAVAREEVERLRWEHNSLANQPLEPGFGLTIQDHPDGQQSLFHDPLGLKKVLGSPLPAITSSVTDTITNHLVALAAPEDAHHLKHTLTTAIKDGTPLYHDYYSRHRDKGSRWLLITSDSQCSTPNGGSRRFIIIWDITDNRRNAQLRHERERDYHTLVEDSPDIIIRYDKNCRRFYINNSARSFAAINKARFFGVVDDEEWVGTTPVELPTLDPQAAEAYKSWLKDCLQTGVPAETSLSALVNGKECTFWARVSPEKDMAGEITSIIVILRDITDQVEAEQKLRQSEYMFRTLVENTPDYLVRYDNKGRRTYINPMVRNTRGKNASPNWIGTIPGVDTGIVLIAEYRAKLAKALESGQQEQGTFEVIIGNEHRMIFILFSPEFDFEGQVRGALMLGRDITDLVAQSAKIERIAYFDTLTGLPNRAALNETISRLCERTEKSPAAAFGLMMLDIDRFKDINDSLGHLIGDQLLKAVADRLLECVRPDDIIARLGGDEFAVVLPETDGDGPLERIARDILQTLARPFEIADRSLFVSASLGITRYPRDSDDVTELFRYADMAMYKAKSLGRNGFAFFDSAMARNAAERMELGTALRTARENGEFELYFQPIVALPRGQVIGAETLIRWNHPRLGLLPPDKFISMAEESELIVEIGAWVIETAANAIVAWNHECQQPLRLSVNLSPRQFLVNDLAETIRTIMEKTGCAAEWITFEITESLLVENNEKTLNTLDILHDAGHGIAIDDFGTGYSAMSYLVHLPIDILKIDRSFVQKLEQGQTALVHAIISMAKALDMTVVAEGVETEEQRQHLEALNCHKAQGYLFSRPQPHDKFAKQFVEPLSRNA